MLSPRRFALVFLFFVILLVQFLRPTTNYYDNDHALLRTTVDAHEWYDEDPSQLNLTIPTPLFQPGTHESNRVYRKALISGHTKKEKPDIEWTQIDIPDVDLYLYTVNDRSAALHPPRNKGREVMVYLTFIIDHYDDLPDVMIFMHAHRRAWHNADVLGNDAVQMIRRLNVERVVREGYMNMRCQWFPGCPDWIHPLEVQKDDQKKEQLQIAPAWQELFPNAPIPDVLAQPCCSQFALSRERVLSIPLEQFEHYRSWLLKSRLADTISGRVFEYLWQYIFTGKTTYCPVEHICYCDGFGVCFDGKEPYDAWHDIRRERDRINHELVLWEQQKNRSITAVQEGFEGVPMPQEGRDVVLQAEIERLQTKMSDQVAKAIERGSDPRVRFRAADEERELSKMDGRR